MDQSEINGPDDLIAACGDEAMAEVLNSSFSPEEKAVGRAAPQDHERRDQHSRPNGAASPSMIPTSFTLVPIGELLSRPVVPPDYLIDGLFVRGTVSCTVAKPKVGKSTLARGACLAVAREIPFLGRKTQKGLCIYLALEERLEEVTADFRAMGATSHDPIEVHAAAAPALAILALIDLIRKRRPALVVIDPLFRLAQIRNRLY